LELYIDLDFIYIPRYNKNVEIWEYGGLTMRDVNIKGNINAPITDFRGAQIGTIIQKDLPNTEINVNYTIKRTSMKELLIGKLKEVLASAISGVIAYISKLLLDQKNLSANFNTFLLVLLIISTLIGVAIIFCAAIDLINSTSLTKNGKFLEFKSKSDFLDSILAPNANDERVYRKAGKIYKNINGQIYEIQGCKCPFCETEPIGFMSFQYNKQDATYELVCNEQPLHTLAFDYKKKINN
jgi:hypothetical protein